MREAQTCEITGGECLAALCRGDETESAVAGGIIVHRVIRKLTALIDGIAKKE